MADKQAYQPINCEIHDSYELACMRNAIHLVEWKEDDTAFSQRLRFLDLEYTPEGEFLIAEDHEGNNYRVRLDSISSRLPY